MKIEETVSRSYKGNHWAGMWRGAAVGVVQR